MKWNWNGNSLAKMDGMAIFIWNGMVIPKEMVIPKSKIYQAKEGNGGKNVIPFLHYIPPYQVGLRRKNENHKWKRKMHWCTLLHFKNIPWLVKCINFLQQSVYTW